MKHLYSSPLESRKLLIALSLLLLLTLAYMLGARTLVPTDEGRYAEMAREMVATGDWLTPRLDAIKYFEKPPLQNWANAISFTLFGLGEWQARLWTGMCGLFGVFLSGYTASRLYGRRTGALTAIVLASCFYWAAMSQINSLDMGLSAMMNLCLCSLMLAQRAGASASESRNWMLLCWLGLALAVLSKGLAGLAPPGMVLVFYTLWTRDWDLWRRLHLGKGLLVFFAVAAPWFILVALKNPEHPHFFFIHEQFQRFTSKIHHRDGAWYYFIPLLLLGIFPWLPLLAQGLWAGVRDKTPGFQVQKLCLIWVAFIFVFYSVSDSKLPGYLLPVFPALALLIALKLRNAENKALLASELCMLVLGLFALLLAPALIAKSSELALEISLLQGYADWVRAAGAALVAGALVSFLMRKRHQDWSVLAIALSSLLAWQILLLGHEPYGRYIAGTDHLAAIQTEITPATKLYAVGRYEQALPFYLQRTMTLVEFPDELQFGLEQEPQLWIPKREDFVKLWTSDAKSGIPAVAIVRNDIFADFSRQGVPMRVIVQDPKRTIVSNQLR
jgi:4-amino-4-deoxy-L-arabinose transferase-like glycosyltransferase